LSFSTELAGCGHLAAGNWSENAATLLPHRRILLAQKPQSKRTGKTGNQPYFLLQCGSSILALKLSVCNNALVEMDANPR
jgi:hypothetical protein